MQIKSKTGRTFELPSDEENSKIKQGIESDPDTYELSSSEMKQLKPLGRPKSDITKERITIRLSREVTEYFRTTGKGWQTRIDKVLQEYVVSHR